MGGDNDPMMVKYLAYQIRSHLDMRVGWYTGVGNALTMREMDYVKIGTYQEQFGPLDSPTTNQVYLERQFNGDWRDATQKFWVHKSTPANP